MKQTKKYLGATAIATLPHNTQEQLYAELNRLGFFWNPKAQKWERNDQLAEPPSKVIRVRGWAESNKVQEVATTLIESFEPYRLTCIEQSEPYVCRPPKQNDSRIYLTFIDENDNA